MTALTDFPYGTLQPPTDAPLEADPTAPAGTPEAAMVATETPVAPDPVPTATSPSAAPVAAGFDGIDVELTGVGTSALGVTVHFRGSSVTSETVSSVVQQLVSRLKGA